MDKDASVKGVGNATGRCKCCGSSKTQSSGQWWGQLQESCDGSTNSELLQGAKTAAAKHFAEIAAKQARKESRNPGKQQSSIIKLNQKELYASCYESSL